MQETMTSIQRLIQYYDITENDMLIMKMHNIDMLSYVNCMINHETNNHFIKRFDNKTQFGIMHALNSGCAIFDHKLETTNVQNEIKFSKINNTCINDAIVLSKTFARAINGSTNFNHYKRHMNNIYDKILKLSVVCENKDTHETMIAQTSFQKIPFESFVANDTAFNSHFNVDQLLPLYKSVIFHNQYIAIEGSIFETNIDVFIYSVLTLTMPIIITNESNIKQVNDVLSELVLHGFDLNGIIMYDNIQLVHFIHNVKWNDYAKHLNALTNNKKIVSDFISNEIIRVKNLINDGFTLIQPVGGFKNMMNLCYNDDPNDMDIIFKTLANLKTRNEMNYDLNHVINIIYFVHKLKNKKQTNQSKLYFQTVIDNPDTKLHHDIFMFADSKLQSPTNPTTTVCCFCPCLEPIDERLISTANCNFDIKMSHLNNYDLNLLSPGWMMSWFSDKNYSIFKNNKRFNVSYLFSLRGISSPTEQMRSEQFTYSVRQHIIDNMHELNVPTQFYITTWNKDLHKKYPHVPLLPDSKQCLYYSMFNISLENSKQNNYFSEKIIDCFLTFTIPLYIGCTNIGEYYDTRGIIFASDAIDLTNKCNSLTPGLYASLHEQCENNHLLVQFWTNQYKHTNLMQNYITFMESCYD